MQFRLTKVRLVSRVNLGITVGSIIFSMTAAVATLFLSIVIDLKSFGEFSLTLATINLLSSIVLLGQPTAITMVLFSDEKKRGDDITSEMIMSIGLVSVSLAAVCFIAWAFRTDLESLLKIKLSWSSIICLIGFVVIQYSMNILILFKRSISLVVCSIVYFLLLTTFVYIYRSPDFYYWAVAIASIPLIFVTIDIFIQNQHKRKSTNNFSLTELLSLGLPAIPGVLIVILNSHADKFILSYFFDVEEVALYSFASMIVIGLGSVLINSLLKGYSVDILQQLQEGCIVEVQSIIFTLSKVLTAAYFIIIFLLTFYLEGLLTLFWNHKYVPSLEYVIALSVVPFVNGIASLYSLIIIRSKRLDLVVKIGGVVVLLNLSLSILLSFAFGSMGVVGGLVLSSIANLFFIFYFSHRFTPLKMPLGQLLNLAFIYSSFCIFVAVNGSS